MNCDVSISRCESYEPEVVKAGLLAALAPIGGLDWVTPGMKIALKVNMMMQIKPEKAGTVHPQIAASSGSLPRTRAFFSRTGGYTRSPLPHPRSGTFVAGATIREMCDDRTGRRRHRNNPGPSSRTGASRRRSA